VEGVFFCPVKEPALTRLPPAEDVPYYVRACVYWCFPATQRLPTTGILHVRVCREEMRTIPAPSRLPRTRICTTVQLCSCHCNPHIPYYLPK
jgi:hypothetical protein